MIAGLGLAESTPGPLILVTEFVGFLGAYRHPRGLDPVMAGTLGALVTTWATFAPCFLWIFLLAPFIERLRGNVRLNAALSAITASVVGVILNLAVWFGWNTLFSAGQSAIARGAEPVPSLSLLDPFALVVATIGFWGIWRRRWGIIPLIGGSAVLGLIYRIAARALAQGG
jgi:chromate transporter